MSVIEAEWLKRAITRFRRRRERGPQGNKAAAHFAQVRAELERAGTPCGPHDMQIGAHARSEWLIVVKGIRPHARRAGGEPGVAVAVGVTAFLRV